MPDVYEEDGAGSTPHTAHRAWKKITCSINFRKQWPNLPFFSEKEQVIFFRRLISLQSTKFGSNVSFHGRPCMFSASMNGSGSNSSTL